MSENTNTVKSNKKLLIWQSVRAIATLVLICMVCCLVLALCNDLLYVSPEEKFARAMAKIYSNYGNGDEEFNNSFKLSSYKTTNTYGTVTDVKKAEDGAYVISSKGGGGYKGTVTIYIVIKERTVSGQKDAVIKAWAVKEHEGETFLGNITSAHQKAWYVNKSIKDFSSKAFEVDNNKVSGTTFSSTAINNAVKAACVFCIDELHLVSTPESEARNAVETLLKGTEYDGYTFNTVTDAEGFSEFAVNEQTTVSFFFEGSKAGADGLEAYVYGTDENRQIVVVKTGLTHAERLEATAVVAQSDNVTAEVVAKVQSVSYFEYLVHKANYTDFEFAGMAELNITFATNESYGSVGAVYTSTDGAVVIEATGTGGWEGGTITLNVVIKDGVIKGWWIVSNVGQSYLYKINAAWNTVKNWYVGSSIDAPLAMSDNTKVSGASFTSTAINKAINMACHYAKNVA